MKRGRVPDFDPLNGGTKAQILFLFEKPGPRAAGSGFISRNNDDPTAEATFAFTEKAGLHPCQYVIWNAIPWWNDTTDLKPDEIKAGLQCLEALLKILRRVRVVVLVGRTAQRAASNLEKMPVMEGKRVILRRPSHTL